MGGKNCNDLQYAVSPGILLTAEVGRREQSTLLDLIYCLSRVVEPNDISKPRVGSFRDLHECALKIIEKHYRPLASLILRNVRLSGRLATSCVDDRIVSPTERPIVLAPQSALW